jgi:phage FluMu protein Com
VETEVKVNNILRMKCPSCGHWNRIPVNKIFLEQPTSEPKVKAYIPMYEPLKVEACKKCGKIIAEPKVLIRIIEGRIEYWKEK